MNYQLNISTECKKLLEIPHENRVISPHIKSEIYQATKNFPASIHLSNRVIAIATDNPCACLFCNKVHGIIKKKFCSTECYHKSKAANPETSIQKAEKSTIARVNKKFDGCTEGVDYFVCKICTRKCSDLAQHMRTHKITFEQYKSEYEPNAQPKIERLVYKGDRNPAYNHGGKYSKWSKNFLHGYNEEEHKKFNESMSDKMKDNPKSRFVRSYYESDEAYSKAQTRDLAYFINKYGEELGKKKHAEKTEKWIKSFKKQNYSMVSQKLFNAIIKKLVTLDHNYFATFDRHDMVNSVNKEYKHKCSNGRFVSFDFVDINKKKVIEFDGDYWHSEKRGNQEREKIRDAMIIESGFDILHILERDYKENPERELDRCLNFLTQ